MFLLNVWQYFNICHLWTWYLASVGVRKNEEQMRIEIQIVEYKILTLIRIDNWEKQFSVFCFDRINLLWYLDILASIFFMRLLITIIESSLIYITKHIKFRGWYCTRRMKTKLGRISSKSCLISSYSVGRIGIRKVHWELTNHIAYCASACSLSGFQQSLWH